MGADRFITNNKRDFPPTITEILASIFRVAEVLA
jgi:hypothetical protein